MKEGTNEGMNPKPMMLAHEQQQEQQSKPFLAWMGMRKRESRIQTTIRARPFRRD
jgi:hypothetical protein